MDFPTRFTNNFLVTQSTNRRITIGIPFFTRFFGDVTLVILGRDQFVTTFTMLGIGLREFAATVEMCI